MAQSADGSTCTTIVLENGVPVAMLDGVTAATRTETFATRSRLPLGQQGSTKEQEWLETNGTISAAAVTPALRDMKARYRANVLAKLPTNITIVTVLTFPDQGSQRRITDPDVKLTDDPTSMARGQDTMQDINWTCGNPPVEG